MVPFWKKVLVALAVVAVALGAVALLGGDGGTLPYQYEGFD